MDQQTRYPPPYMIVRGILFVLIVTIVTLVLFGGVAFLEPIVEG